jgi:hypothetical protein
MRTLVQALSELKIGGDHFSLTVAGKEAQLKDGFLVSPQDFRYGYLKVALDQLFGEKPAAKAKLSKQSIEEALRHASKALAKDGSEDRALGSTLVLLVTARTFGDDTSALEQIARRSAINKGVPVSVIALGNEPELSEIDRIALAGQGNRRIISDPRQAKDVVQRELSAISKVVARALRLNIRLAPGVKLVEVLGSERLNPKLTAQVRKAEKKST